MKNKVAYTILLLVLGSTFMFAQKPSFDLLQSSRTNKIPEAIIDTRYYNDSTGVIKEIKLDSFRIEKKDSVHHETEESEKLFGSLSGKLIYLIFTSRLDYSFSTLYRSFIHM